MDFLESDEHRDLRAAVGAIAARFGGDYYVEHARAGTPCDELWSTLGDAGFIGVNVAEEYGGGGGGLVELAIVCEEIANQGAPLLLLLVLGGDLGRGDRRVRLAGAAQGVAARASASGRTKVVFAITEPDAGSNTHRLATTATRDGDGWVLRGTKHYISGVDEAAALHGGGAQRPQAGRVAAALAVRRAHRRPGPGPHPAAGRHPAAGQAVRAALRRRARARGGPRRRGGRGLPAGVPRPQPGADHRRGARRRHRPLRPAPRPPSTPPPAGCGTCRSAPTRASPTRSPRRRSRPSWPR